MITWHKMCNINKINNNLQEFCHLLKEELIKIPPNNHESTNTKQLVNRSPLWCCAIYCHHLGWWVNLQWRWSSGRAAPHHAGCDWPCWAGQRPEREHASERPCLCPPASAPSEPPAQTRSTDGTARSSSAHLQYHRTLRLQSERNGTKHKLQGLYIYFYLFIFTILLLVLLLLLKLFAVTVFGYL